jgi:thiazole synthase ThiGH ThiG subunit
MNIAVLTPKGTISKKELAVMYRVSRETLRKMLIKCNICNKNKLLYPNQLNVFYLKYGKP